jgi:hypothetical protein
MRIFDETLLIKMKGRFFEFQENYEDLFVVFYISDEVLFFD